MQAAGGLGKQYLQMTTAGGLRLRREPGCRVDGQRGVQGLKQKKKKRRALVSERRFLLACAVVVGVGRAGLVQTPGRTRAALSRDPVQVVIMAIRKIGSWALCGRGTQISHSRSLLTPA